MIGEPKMFVAAKSGDVRVLPVKVDCVLCVVFELFHDVRLDLAQFGPQSQQMTEFHPREAQQLVGRPARSIRAHLNACGTSRRRCSGPIPQLNPSGGETFAFPPEMLRATAPDDAPCNSLLR